MPVTLCRLRYAGSFTPVAPQKKTCWSGAIAALPSAPQRGVKPNPGCENRLTLRDSERILAGPHLPAEARNRGQIAEPQAATQSRGCQPAVWSFYISRLTRHASLKAAIVVATLPGRPRNVESLEARAGAGPNRGFGGQSTAASHPRL